MCAKAKSAVRGKGAAGMYFLTVEGKFQSEILGLASARAARDHKKKNDKNFVIQDTFSVHKYLSAQSCAVLTKVY